MRNQAVFLDRDGTIIEEVGYLDEFDKMKLLPNAPEAIRLINAAGMKAVVVTNQAGVAKGFFDESFVQEVHRRLNAELLNAGAHIERFYYCPHHPEEGLPPYRRTCSCRKPAPGMILEAARELKIDLTQSFFIGDTARDMEAAAAAGVKGILVKTGYGRDNLDGRGNPVYIAEDLLAAVRWLLEELRR